MTDEEIRELAREILARDEFARWREEPGRLHEALLWLADALRRVWEQLQAWLPDWLVDLFPFEITVDVSESLSPLGPIVGLLATILVVIALVVLARSIVRRGSAAALPAAVRVESSVDLHTEAERLAGQGRYLEAAHTLQLAALQVLIERRVVELDRFEPNRTLRRRVVASGLPEALQREFLRLLDSLEARWFGDRAQERSLYDRWHALHAELALLGATS